MRGFYQYAETVSKPNVSNKGKEMTELLANPFYYWGALAGLLMATAVVASTGFFMAATSFKVMNVIRMKNYKKSIMMLLENMYFKNYKANPEVAQVVKTLLQELDPKRAAEILDMLEKVKGSDDQQV